MKKTLGVFTDRSGNQREIVEGRPGFRHWLIRKLAGSNTIILNAKIRGTVVIDSDFSLVADSVFEV